MAERKESVFQKYMKPARPLDESFALESDPVISADEPVESIVPEDPPEHLDFTYLVSRVSMPSEFQPNPEWRSKCMTWFSHLRAHLSNRVGGEFGVKGMIRSIDSGEFPHLNNIGDFEPILPFLNFFGGRGPHFRQCELSWLFACLAFVDRLVSADVAESLERILTQVSRQMIDSGEDSELYAYLAVCFTLLTSFFHRG
jgi:hypothetical protein